jgi:GH18 family chitinase
LCQKGWEFGSSEFSELVHKTKRRRGFVQNAADFLIKNKFDGLGYFYFFLNTSIEFHKVFHILDLDWEFPGCLIFCYK